MSINTNARDSNFSAFSLYHLYISDEELTRNQKRYTMNEGFSMVVEQVLFPNDTFGFVASSQNTDWTGGPRSREI
ncbi:hypothetical protein AAHA92_25213 [Salvia divinorum]|uniref:Uncharacterized protein n=1 Tax=Salvia divinorum TaxID=28513 RepID=A0ABD1G9W3_SALDI